MLVHVINRVFRKPVGATVAHCRSSLLVRTMKVAVWGLLQLLSVSLVWGLGWKLDDSITGEDYFNKFNFYAGPDGADNMTHGMVNYVDMPNAKRLNLSYANGDNFVMRVDTTMEQPNGRPSVRLHSKKSYRDSVIMYVEDCC